MTASPHRTPHNPAARALLDAVRRNAPGSSAPTLHTYRLQGLEAAQRLQDRPRPR